MIKRIEFSTSMSPVAPQPNLAGCNMRFVVYQNKECRGSLITQAQVFKSNTVETLRETVQKPSVTLLRDTVSAGIASSATTAGPKSIVQFTVPVNKRVDYVSSSGPPGVVADLLKIDIGYGMICDVPLACTMTIAAKVIYVDL